MQLNCTPLSTEFLSLIEEYSIKNSKDFSTLSSGSAGKYIWKCKTCAYEWDSRIAHRLSGSSNCPACSKKILTTAHPELAAEWGAKNETSSDEHKPGSRERVWWKCGNGLHEEYMAAIANRRRHNVNCPECRDVRKGKSVEEIAPHLISQWSEKNNKTPAQTYAAAATKIIWECDKCSHEWSTRISYRVEQDRGCPKCNGRLIQGKSVADLLPQLVSEWSDKNPLHPHEIAAGSRKLIIWDCPNQHGEYQMRPFERLDGYYCSKCVLAKKSLAIREPKIASEWHPTKNLFLLPQDVMSGSQKKAWWKCSKNHEWFVSITSRTSTQSGCPTCARSSISDVEAELRTLIAEDAVIQSIQPNHSTRLFIPMRQRNVLSVDILGVYSDYPIVIEYDGWYWHSGQRKNDPVAPYQRDNDKTLALLEAGYLVVRVREKTKYGSLKPLAISHPRLLQLNWVYQKDSLELRQDIYQWLESLLLDNAGK